MRNFCFFLLLLLAAFASVNAGTAANGAASANAPNQLTAWRLDQDTMVGKMRVYITPKAVRAEDLGRGCTFVCKSPDWKVTIYRDSDKVETQFTLDHWNGHGNRMFYSAFSPSDVSKIKWEPTTYLGFKSYKYFSSQPHVVTPHQKLDDVKVASYKILGIDYIMTDQIPAAPEISKFMQGLYCCSYVKGIPLANRNIIADQSWKPRFITTKAAKVQVDPTIFNAPNYKIADERAVFFGRADKEALEDMLGGLGVGSNGFGEGKMKRD